MSACHLRKTLFATAWIAMSLAGSTIAPAAHAADTTLNVYNWSDYIGKDTIPNFEKETGIQVKYDNYDSDDTLQAKMLAGSSGYDIVVPTSTYMAKQIQAGIYQKLDKSKLPNLSNLDSWALLFDPANVAKLKGCGVSFLDSASDVFPAVLQYQHKDPNSTNPADYMAALEVLKKVRPYITQFNSSGYINDLANNDICVAFGFSGDVGIARRRASEAKRSYEVKFFNPKEGGLLWLDIMVIPKDAPHPEAALKWINYILQPKVSAGITNEVFYPTANAASKPFIDPVTANDTNVFPPAEVMNRLTVMKAVPSDILRLENRLWAELKTGR